MKDMNFRPLGIEYHDPYELVHVSQAPLPQHLIGEGLTCGRKPSGQPEPDQWVTAGRAIAESVGEN